mgnify:FL=1|tara:strand:- start:353 stop:745 length:393 start_codon:yes stop_codon:yes gene_type:complete
MRHEKKENRGRPSEKQVESPRQFTRVFYDFPSKPELGEKHTWYYDLDKTDKGPYLVEIYDPKFDKIEKLYNKLEKLQTPKFHENGRKKRTTKIDKIKMETTERAYWKEHYRLFPEDIPKKRGRKSKKSNV